MIKRGLLAIFGIVFLINFIVAVPVLTIHSPQNTTYNQQKVLVNITSNEPVDFYVKDARDRSKIVLIENSTKLETNIYINEGEHEFTILANNSDETINETVFFSSTMHNPINITSCGILSSSDTEYVLQNDITPGGSDQICLTIRNIRNITIDLNGYTVNSGIRNAFSVLASSDIEIFNGSINGSPSWNGGPFGGPWGIEVEGTKLYFHDLNINIHWGIVVAFSLHNVLFERVNVNSSIGFYFLPVTNTIFKNSTFTWNGYEPAGAGTTASAFTDFSDHSELYLEEVNITGFPQNDFNFIGSFTDVYLRSTHINMSKISYPNIVADTRFFTQHLGVINVTNLIGQPKVSTINISDNRTFQKKSQSGLVLETLTNPTSEVLTSTDDSGVAKIWLTEKLTYAKSSSPPEITEYDFSPYNVTVVNGEVTDSALLTLTNLNSTIPVNFSLNIPQALPKCTISQMLDLNNDGNVNIHDSLIITKYAAGQGVTVSNVSKNCEGINFLNN